MTKAPRRAEGTTAAGPLIALLIAGVMLLSACGGVEGDVPLEAGPIMVVQVGTASTSVEMRALDGAMVSGIVEVYVEAASSVREVRFVLDDATEPFAIARAKPFYARIDTATLADGRHVLIATTPKGRRGLQALASAAFEVRNVAPPLPVDPEPVDPPPVDPPPVDPEPVDPPPVDPPPVDPAPDGAVRIRVGQDARSIVASHPGGTAFVFEEGVHRLTGSITPRRGDTFVGEPGAVLSGARQLTAFERAGGLWVARGQAQEGWLGAGSCNAAAPRCRHPEELFIDDVRLHHVATRGEVRSGTWHFDYAADAIYFADDPSGRRVETSVVSTAIVGGVDDVTVRGLVVEKFANAAQHGAIMAERVATTVTYGRGWVIEDNVVRWNHGVGIRAGSGAVIRGNTVVGNGQLGIASVGGSNTLIERNEIGYNNAAGYEGGWEAGGTKFVATTGLVVRENHVHHNAGSGLWTDIDNVGTLYEFNLVEHNRETGIFHEISYGATIRHNIVRFNGLELGLDRYAYVFGAGILAYASSDVEIYGNTVVGNLNGIVGLMHERGSGAFGRYELRGLYVHGNDVAMAFHPNHVGPQGERGVWGVSGVSQDGGFGFVFESAADNRFERNRYQVSSLTAAHYTWLNAGRRFSSWTTVYQQDAGATAAVGTGAGMMAMR